jgi:hypothetical protein
VEFYGVGMRCSILRAPHHPLADTGIAVQGCWNAIPAAGLWTRAASARLAGIGGVMFFMVTTLVRNAPYVTFFCSELDGLWMTVGTLQASPGFAGCW